MKTVWLDDYRPKVEPADIKGARWSRAGMRRSNDEPGGVGRIPTERHRLARPQIRAACGPDELDDARELREDRVVHAVDVAVWE